MTFLIPSDIEWEVWMRFYCVGVVIMGDFLLKSILNIEEISNYLHKLLLFLSSPHVRRAHLVIQEESASRPLNQN